MPSWLRQLQLSPLWVRVSYIYGEARPTSADYWAFLPENRGSGSLWPFKLIDEWDGVEAWPLDDVTLTSEVAGEGWSLYLSEVGDAGDGLKLGASSRVQGGVCLSLDPPAAPCSKLFARDQVDAFTHLVRLLAPLRDTFGATVYVQGEAVGSVDAAVAAVAATVRDRVIPGRT